LTPTNDKTLPGKLKKRIVVSTICAILHRSILGCFLERESVIGSLFPSGSAASSCSSYSGRVIRLMRPSAIFSAWGRILTGYRPFLSVEITKQCPLRCPGCYAFDSGHLNNSHSIRELKEWSGTDLVDRTLELVRQSRPLHVSIVGGEPLVRYRELTGLIRQLDAMGIEVQVITSAVRPIPEEWSKFSNLHLVISIDGLMADHDVRRAPATYDRILDNIAGHQVIIHCTILPHFLRDENYLSKFAETWSAQKNTRKIWFSLFTPQKGDLSPERLTAEERATAINRISRLRAAYPKVHAPGVLLEAMRHPPDSPSDCIFAQVTQCVSTDLSTSVLPCQIGGQPECSECGCMAAAGFSCIGNYKLGGFLKLSDIFSFSRKLGLRLRSAFGRA
jgi:sulfatase maturation enzyme AslB (radical SAM superfamily)